MNSILARRVGLVLGLVALGLSSGCASNRKEGPELNPRVTGRPSFVGTLGLRRVELKLEVEQQEPWVMRNHTWTVNVWTGRSSSEALSADQVDMIMSEPPFASIPDLNARKSEVEIKTLDYDVPHSGGYYVVVVAAIEKTKGERSKVHAVKTFAAAFEKGGDYSRDVVIPEFPPVSAAQSLPPPPPEPAPEAQKSKK